MIYLNAVNLTSDWSNDYDTHLVQAGDDKQLLLLIELHIHSLHLPLLRTAASALQPNPLTAQASPNLSLMIRQQYTHEL